MQKTYTLARTRPRLLSENYIVTGWCTKHLVTVTHTAAIGMTTIPTQMLLEIRGLTPLELPLLGHRPSLVLVCVVAHGTLARGHR